MKYYKHEEFPEIMLSDSDVVAVIQNPKQLERVILEQNDLIDRLIYKDEEIERLRIQVKTLSVDSKPDWATEEDVIKVLKEIKYEEEVIKIAKEIGRDCVDGSCKLCIALSELDSSK